MKVIFLISGRGGQSKTNIAYAIAHIANSMKIKTALLDIDTNQLLFQKMNKRQRLYEKKVVNKKVEYKYGHISFTSNEIASSNEVVDKIIEFAGDADLLVIDSFGHLSQVHQRILPIVDTVVIPTVPEDSGIISATQAFAVVNNKFVELLAEAGDIQEENLPTIHVAKTRWKGKLARVFDQDLAAGSLEYGYDVLTSYTTEFDAQYKLADYIGVAITELPEVLSGKEAESSEKAALQMKVLAKEVLKKTGFKV